MVTVFKRLSILALTLLLVHSPALAADSVREYRHVHEHEILKEFMELLAIPNVASDRENIRRNAAAIMTMMQRRKLSPRLLELSDPAAPPVVYGEWKTPGATRTLIFYAHYDGQPTDPKQWSGTLPWQPVLRSAALEAGGKILPDPKADEQINPEWRLYGRSAADDKAGVMAILYAFDALLASGMKPTANLKFFFEGRRGRLAPYRGNTPAKQTTAAKRCVDHLRRTGAPVRAQAGGLRRPRRYERRRNCLWRQTAVAQRSLWKLGAQSCVYPDEAAGFDEG